MPFDPAKPVEGTLCDAVEMRAQLTGLKDLIDAGSVTGAQTQNTGTLPPGSAATADVALSAGTLTFTFGIPAGAPGEVTQAQLSNDLVNCQNAAMLATLPQTSANSNAVSLLGLTVSDPPTQAELQAVADKVDELLSTLRR